MGTGSQYNWTPPTGLNFTDIRTPVFKYDRTVDYLITINPTNGCRVVDTLRVLIVTSAPPLRSSLHVPNAWSPNNDGSNDKLYPLTINMKELYYFRVFNRWGQVVFATSEQGKGWDGSFKGSQQDPGTYVWMAEGETYMGEVIKKQGTIILLR